MKKDQIDQEKKVDGNTESRQPPQYTYWFFTWNNWMNNEVDSEDEKDIDPIDQGNQDISREDILFNFQNVLKHECKWFIFQEETGESGTEHLQGTLCLQKKQRLTELKKLNRRINWQPTRSVKASIEYCTKYETRSGDIYYHGIDLPEKIDLCTPYGWQLEVLKIIQQKPDNRSIYWFWEPNGGVGKTELAKYLVVKHNALMLTGKSQDMYHMISKFPKKRKLILCDVPKSSMEYINYSAIEQIKNGLIFSGKYEGTQLVFNSPHVFVFANEEPDYEAMSRDRWKVKRITL